ncbi:MAG: hypothetical protein K9H25_11185 [Rhodospirillum sp.]|nr:hypothetical protein [Rhodospirillum sp.]MCF8489500.1 hypothetical protein [Rhodospirillum sp.]
MGCFDTIDHHELMRRVRARIGDITVIRLLGRPLKAEVLVDGIVKWASKAGGGNAAKLSKQRVAVSMEWSAFSMGLRQIRSRTRGKGGVKFWIRVGVARGCAGAVGAFGEIIVLGD